MGLFFWPALCDRRSSDSALRSSRLVAVLSYRWMKNANLLLPASYLPSVFFYYVVWIFEVIIWGISRSWKCSGVNSINIGEPLFVWGFFTVNCSIFFVFTLSMEQYLSIWNCNRWELYITFDFYQMWSSIHISEKYILHCLRIISWS